MVDVVVIERRVMTAVSDDANAAHIQQPTLGPINRKGESLSRKFSGDDLRRAQSNTTDAHRSEARWCSTRLQETGARKSWSTRRDSFCNTTCNNGDARRRNILFASARHESTSR